MKTNPFGVRYAYRDASISKDNYYFTISTANELTFFSGHGFSGGDGEVSYDGYSLTPGTFAFGGWNRWYFSSTCQSLRNSSPAAYTSMFGGLHAFFGYASNTKEYIQTYSCGFGVCHHRSEDLWGKMWDKWVNGGWYMWDAYTDAAKSIFYNYINYGVRPAVVYLKGYVNGVYFIGHTEKVTTTYNGDVDKNSLQFSYTYIDFGTPSY